jgi:pimeloyl-ACP methyl ester carboxylesterase
MAPRVHNSGHWTIEGEIAAIACPLRAVQGVDDEYGTLEQIRGIAWPVPQTERLELAECGHSPHRDRPEAVIEASSRFVAGIIDTRAQGPTAVNHEETRR